VELAGVVVGEAVIVTLAIVDRAVALPVLFAAFETLQVEPKRRGEGRER